MENTAAQVFGTVLHSVCERYLLADDLGNGPDGKTVNIYPDKWHVAVSRFGKPCPKCSSECGKCKGAGKDCKDCKGKGRSPATGLIEYKRTSDSCISYVACDKCFGTRQECDGKIDPFEMDLIQRLVAKAIEEGVLERLPGRKIEGDFRTTVLKMDCPMCEGKGEGWTGKPCPYCKGCGEDNNTQSCTGCAGTGDEYGKCPNCDGDGKGTHIQIVGFIDLQGPDWIQDHKSTKNMRYAKSPAKLAENGQMLLYAKQLLIKAKERGEPFPNNITLRHNVFCKEGTIRKTEVQVTPLLVENHWHRFTQDVIEMEKIRQTKNTVFEIPEPATGSNACNAYGGCPFRSICSGQETEEKYEKRLASHALACDTPSNESLALLAARHIQPLAIRGEGSMSAFDAAIAKTKGMRTPAAPGAAAVLNPPVTAAPAAPVAQVASPVVQAVAPPPPTPPASNSEFPPPPWTNSTCMACKGVGFNSRGNPCRICDSTAASAGRLPSSAFTIEAVGNGLAMWMQKDNDDIAGQSYVTGSAPAPVKAVEKAQDAPVAPAPVAAPVAPPVTTPAVTAVATEESDDSEGGKNKGGRPKKGFMLFINIHVTKGNERQLTGRFVHRGEDVLAKFGLEMAAQAGVPSFYDLDVWKRRDALKSAGAAIAESFKNDIVAFTFVGSAESDLKALLDAIRPFAGFEAIGGTGL